VAEAADNTAHRAQDKEEYNGGIMPILGRSGRTTYLDEDPESVQGDIFRNLRGGIQQVGGLALQQKLENIKRQQAIEDAIALIKVKMQLEREIRQQTSRDKVTEAIRLLKAKQRYDPAEEIKRQKLGDIRRMRTMAGLEEPSETEISSVATMPKFRRNILGRAGGGQVLAPEGAAFKEGEILSKTGGRIGEYLPGYEPTKTQQITPTAGEVAGEMRTKFAPGVSREELSRKALGLPRFTGGATEGQVYKVAKDLALAENPLAGEREIQAKIPIAEKMMKRTATFGQGIIDTPPEDIGGELPNASQYEEGTIYEDDNGTQYKVVNGEWEEL